MTPRKKRLVVVFAKYPEPGSVKTRLAKTIGDSSALRVYEAMLSMILRQCLAARRSFDLIFYFDPAAKQHEFQRWLDAADLHPDAIHPQPPKPLGERLDEVFCWGFEAGYRAVAAIGSDCLAVDVPLLEHAFDALESCEVCIGPSRDGGYYLVAARSHLPSLFQEMPWSESGLTARTREVLEQNAITYSMLAEERDVDDFDDLMALPKSIRNKVLPQK